MKYRLIAVAFLVCHTFVFPNDDEDKVHSRTRGVVSYCKALTDPNSDPVLKQKVKILQELIRDGLDQREPHTVVTSGLDTLHPFDGMFDPHSSIHGHLVLLLSSDLTRNERLQNDVKLRLKMSDLEKVRAFLKENPTHYFPYAQAWLVQLLRALEKQKPNPHVDPKFLKEFREEIEERLVTWLEKPSLPTWSGAFEKQYFVHDLLQNSVKWGALATPNEREKGPQGDDATLERVRKIYLDSKQRATLVLGWMRNPATQSKEIQLVLNLAEKRMQDPEYFNSVMKKRGDHYGWAITYLLMSKGSTDKNKERVEKLKPQLEKNRVELMGYHKLEWDFLDTDALRAMIDIKAFEGPMYANAPDENVLRLTDDKHRGVPFSSLVPALENTEWPKEISYDSCHVVGSNVTKSWKVAALVRKLIEFNHPEKEKYCKYYYEEFLYAFEKMKSYEKHPEYFTLVSHWDPQFLLMGLLKINGSLFE